MTSITNLWRRFQSWLAAFLQSPSGTIQEADFDSAESYIQQGEIPLDDWRAVRQAIRINLNILQDEITELTATAEKAPPSTNVTAAKALLQKAEGALLLEMGLFALSAATTEQLGDILGQVFDAMNQSNRARHLLNACH